MEEVNQHVKTYLGNQNLKKEGQAIAWSADMIKEYTKCANSATYFIEKYVKIVHVDRGFISIDLYPYQKDIIIAIEKNRLVAVNTSRQAGKTTTAVAIILHYILFSNHKTVALLANKGDSAREILERLKMAYESLPVWLQQGVLEWNKGSVFFENGCKIIAGSTSSSAIRGKSVSFLYIDETAWVENWDEFFASVYPTISSGETTKILLTSTPKGLNHFYKTCSGAMENKNGYIYIEVQWQDVPGRDEKWKRETLAAMDGDYEKFEQEFCCQFLGSSGTLISGSRLKAMVDKTPIQLGDNGLKMYNKPEKDRIYACVVDTSRGKGLDYSAFHILDITKMPYSQVCTYRNNTITPKDYTEIVYRTSMAYNEAFVLIEINDIGGQVSDVLYDDYEYDNILYTESAGRSGKRICSVFGKSTDRGIRTTKNVKNIGCSMLKLLIEQEQLVINDLETIGELSTFSKKGVSYQAEPGHHDDLVMGLVLFAWLTDQVYFKDLTDINTLSMLRDKTEQQILDDLLPFGFYDGGQEGEMIETEYLY
jgi:hypothetical protein